ncbi:MAG: RNA polymerase sigma factor [Deltaproteobacteria bacterium]|nr:RNA polymerase sigma factor [Deltaproteobacteria bacterium]
MEPGSDADIIERSLGEPAAFASLYDRHAAVLYRFLVRRIGPSAADGLLGDTFRIAFERRASFDRGHESARPWLYGIATRVLAHHRRAEARRMRAAAVLVASREAPIDPAQRAAASHDARELWPLVADAISALPVGERDALLLHVWEDLAYDEIARALGVPIGTVRSRINRARRRLRELTAQSGQQAATRSAAGRGKIES